MSAIRYHIVRKPPLRVLVEVFGRIVEVGLLRRFGFGVISCSLSKRLIPNVVYWRWICVLGIICVAYGRYILDLERR